MLGYDFDRQRPINNFIVDFYCKDLMLAIEVDGSSHDSEEAYEKDKKRQSILENLGVQFLRFDDLDVKKNISNVLRTIQYWIEEYMENKKPTPSPSKEGNSIFNDNVTPLSGIDNQTPLLGGVGVVHNLPKLLEIAKTAAIKAAVEILAIYDSDDFSVESKADNSPLTRADKASHNAIVAELEKTNIPILSEEGRDIAYEERKDWEYFWMIDPLDGTKEFIKRNGEFTVNIALIHASEVVLGIVQVPVTSKLYFAQKNVGAFLEANGQTNKLTVNKIKLDQHGIKVVASRSHLNDETQEFMDKLSKPEIVSMGSSLKLLAVAEGKADLYPRYAPTMEWDTAAAQAIVEEAGGTVNIKGSDDSVKYNKSDLLNPHFLVSCTILG